MPRPLLLVLPLVLLAASCSDGESSGSSSVATTTAATTTTEAPADDTTTTGAPETTVTVDTAPDTAAVDTTAAATTTPDTSVDPTTPTSTVPAGPCDEETSRSCLLPWPNDRFTVADEATGTGLRLAIPADLVPTNADGVPIDVTDQNRGDGFSPGSTILIDAPGINVELSNLAPSTNIGLSLEVGSPIVITDTVTGEPWPYWAELDAQAPADDERLLMIHPAISLTEGHTYDVNITQLWDGDHNQVELDVTSWSFTVASAESLSGRLLHMRDDAYASLGDSAPSFQVTESSDAGSVRTVEGTIDVPLYLSNDGAPGSVMLLDDSGLPTRNPDNPTFPARFRCVLPLAAAGPVPTIVYGHGLLNDRTEVDALSFAAELGLAAACAMDWIGMSGEDIQQVVANLGELSTFNTQADRMQQGQLDFQFLGRALNDERAFATHSAFNTAEGTPIIAPGETQFVGNSQGGILGGAASAISTEWERAVLGVPGINYSLLLHRSSDWPQFQTVFDVAYPDAVDRVIALQVIQLLWDRGENNGYAQHLTAEPYPGIEAKEVLLIEAFGDHQVANVSTEILARTLGVPVHEPSLGEGRSNDVDPQWGIDPLEGNTGSALFVWDFGTPAPPPVNLPPTDPEYGEDPHGAGSNEQRVLTLALGFLLTGELQDVCGTEACVSDVMTG